MKTLQLTALTITFILALLPAASSAAPFQLSADRSEVTDQATGLIWRHCAEGLSGIECGSGTVITFSHEAALQRAASESTGGLEWRLPNIKELYSIVDVNVSTMINANFPATPTLKLFWSSSPWVDIAAYAWYVNFLNGLVWTDARANSNYVRLVRAGQ